MFLIFSLFLAAEADDGARGNRRREEETRAALENTEYNRSVAPERVVFDYGGWLNFLYIDYHEDDKDSSQSDEIDYTLWQDSRLWAKVTLKPPADASYENEHSFYLRIKNLYTIDRPNQTAGGCDNDGPHLDYAYGTLDLRPLWVNAGQLYFSVGQGIAYSDLGDGIEVKFQSKKLNLKAFVSRSLRHQDNIDTSVPGYDKHTRRLFYGLEASYLVFPAHSLYGYTVIQRDKSKEEPDDPEHDYKYDSKYFGLGARGKLSPTLSYWWEFIAETGKSLIYDSNEKKDVSAWANVFALSYEPELYSSPEFHFKYAYSSGDKDRVSVTDTENGNSFGKDKNFLCFGFIPTGYALTPQFSNLQFFKTGFSFQPLEKMEFFKHFSCGLDYYRYYKAQAAGGIYDEQAVEDSHDVGQELDASVSWQIFSDLNITFEYGYFFPGKAYPVATHDNEEYFSLSTTFTF